jgi:D-inositol-3-phosphate glycosyltransferase
MADVKKVIIIGPAHPLRGGIANFNEALCKAMNTAGISTSITSFSLQYPSFLFPGTTQYDAGKAPDGVPINTLINAINPLNWWLVAKKIKQAKPDYVIIRFWLPFMGPCLGSIAKLIKQNSSIKIIAITDNVIPHEKRIGDKVFTKYFIKQCDGFIAMSKSVLNDLNTFTNNTHKLFLPHPIYDIFGDKIDKTQALKHLHLNTDDKHLLFFGFIRKYKGLDLLLKAMADERIKKLNIKLIVAGEYYEDATPYNTLISDLGIEKNVILRTNYIEKEDVAHYFCASDMITQPYREATQSGVTQIAYHFERPMLVTNIGGLPEIVTHLKVGYVTEPTPSSIADAIVDFYTHNKEQEFATNTIVEKKRFLWSTFVEGIEKLYANLT